MEPITNRGTGAGGAATVANGGTFEKRTDNKSRLLANGFIRKEIPKKEKLKYGYYLEKDLGDGRSIVYVMQSGMKEYCAHFLGKEVFRHPDEAYIFKDADGYRVKILEKKTQNVEGSVDTKLCAGTHFIEEYEECLGEGFKVEYAFCLSQFLQKHYVSEEKKWTVMRKIHKKHNIRVFFGEDDDYYSKLDEWLV